MYHSPVRNDNSNAKQVSRQQHWRLRRSSRGATTREWLTTIFSVTVDLTIDRLTKGRSTLSIGASAAIAAHQLSIANVINTLRPSPDYLTERSQVQPFAVGQIRGVEADAEG